ncbi:hypothetical protein MMC07_005122 [Pseudocyphellaria aurata]|nr:hypothetical protein [Pseudocyphellaria aurata]
MRFSSTVAALLAVGLGLANPVEKRHIVHTPTVNDVVILNYALTLEYLERKFYSEALANFTQADFVKAGFADPFYENLKEIYVDEQTHVSFLSGAITAAKYTPTVELEYKFGVTTVLEFVTLSSVLEGVGTSAYLGAAAFIVNKDYLTAAGSILTVEARHTAYIRSQLKESPFPFPFDTPLDFNQVFSLAAAFITGGKSPVTLPFQAFPKLTLAASKYLYEADRSCVTFTGAFANAKAFDSSITEQTKIYAVFFSGLQKIAVEVKITGKDYKVEKLPAGIAGQVYVVLSRSSTEFKDESYIAGPAILEVYPKGGAHKY